MKSIMYLGPMKKQIKKLLVIGAVYLSAATTAMAADYLSITVDNANIRSGPGTNYPTAMELFQGYPLKILKKDGEWYQVSDFESDTGWVHKSIVRPCNTVIVNSKNSINMRSGPSTKNANVADIERGVVLTKISQQGQWVEVKHSSGTTGWVYAPLLWP
jgi:SH3-like domain-containing protein